MTKSSRKADAKRAIDKVKKTEYLCEECNSEVVKMSSTYVCGTCGLTQIKDKLIGKKKINDQIIGLCTVCMHFIKSNTLFPNI